MLRSFHRAAQFSPAYQTLLAESSVQASQVRTPADFAQLCPLLEKTNTFRRFPIEQLIVANTKLADLASILTSSGHGQGGYALGISTRNQYNSTPFLIDLGLDLAFNVDSRRTLLINCLPMGVTFQSKALCVANVSVREDMACAIVKQTGHLFEQIILCGDPLFLKRLCDYSEELRLDWARYKMNVIIGEETFTESFRDYLAASLAINLSDANSGLIGSSMGVGELGLNLFNETRESIAIRRACVKNKTLLQDLMGDISSQAPLPTLLCFNPLRTYVEVVNRDASGNGDLVVSVLDTAAPVPLMRYKTGDRAKLIDADHLAQVLQKSILGLTAPALPLIALLGRSKDMLPGNWHVDHFKQVLYNNPNVARECSGAFRLSQREDGLLWEVQLRLDCPADPMLLADALSADLVLLGKEGAAKVHCLSYEKFPYGKTLDYERKFVYCSA
ncbi:hypothetical protein [Solimicrobium silvestre]|uniref:hypothetical protein n=1 Tax=Solimicrobium silvestre TaxID=2099400 RepID=UPI001057394D|nr:hypothetical protein [Solimicrobium silvestre]